MGRVVWNRRATAAALLCAVLDENITLWNKVPIYRHVTTRTGTVVEATRFAEYSIVRTIT